MKIPKYFERWLDLFGKYDEERTGAGFYSRHSVKRIAWRAYRKGKKDGSAQVKALQQELIDLKKSTLE